MTPRELLRIVAVASMALGAMACSSLTEPSTYEVDKDSVVAAKPRPAVEAAPAQAAPAQEADGAAAPAAVARAAAPSNVRHDAPARGLPGKMLEARNKQGG